jgi:DNA-nicking Smr family endonuclease
MASRDDEFRAAVADAKPLKPAKRVALKPSPVAPVPVQRRRDEAAALAESLSHGLSLDDVLESDEETSYLRPGLARQTLRKLRRGHWAIQNALDLHGLTREEAAVAVVEFLRECLVRRHRCVRIVHGKGTGLLRAKLRRWLPQREEVLAWCQAPANEGGAGALLVLLRSGKS